MIKLVIVESPFAGDREANVEYARKACRDCLERGETPFASHLLYPQMLEDGDADERDWGINAGYDWGYAAQKAAEAPSGDNHPNFSVLIVFYIDRSWSSGMEKALATYTSRGLPCEVRRLEPVGGATNGSSQIDTPDE